MAGQVKLVVTAEMAQAFSAFSKLVDQTGRAEKGMDRLAAAGDRAGRAQATAVSKMVGRVQAQTRGAELALGQAERAALRMGMNPGGGALATSIERRMVAQQLREQRSFEQFARERRSAMVGRWAASQGAMDSLLARGGSVIAASQAARAAASEAAFNASASSARNNAAVASWAAFGRGPGEDKIYARARADVARNVAGMGELQGKVAAEDLEQMTGRRAAQLQRRQQVRQNVAGGALAVGAAVAGVVNSAEQQLNQYAENLSGYERDLSPLFGVGSNMASRGRIGREVLQTAAGLGVDRGQLAAAQFNIQSFASDLSPAVRAAILRGGMNFHRLQGSSMQTTTSALTAAYKIVGGELEPGAAGVKQLESRLAYGADVGAFEVDQVTPYLGMVLSAYKGMGYRSTDAISSMILASQSGARPEQFMTGARNLPLLMAEGERKGTFRRTGRLVEDARQLAAMESPEMLETFGRDTFVVAKAVADNVGAIEKYTAVLEGITGRADLIGDKLALRYTDPKAGIADVVGTANQIVRNAPIGQLDNPAVADAVESWSLIQAGAAENYGPMAKALKFDRLGAMVEYATGAGVNRDTAVLKQIAAARAAGDEKQASYLTLKYGGGILNGGKPLSYYYGAGGEVVRTSGHEAEGLRRMWSEVPGMTAGQYNDYMSLRFGDPGEADRMKTRLQRRGLKAAAGGSADVLAGVATMFGEAVDRFMGGARDTAAHTE